MLIYRNLSAYIQYLNCLLTLFLMLSNGPAQLEMVSQRDCLSQEFVLVFSCILRLLYDYCQLKSFIINVLVYLFHTASTNYIRSKNHLHLVYVLEMPQIKFYDPGCFTFREFMFLHSGFHYSLKVSIHIEWNGVCGLCTSWCQQQFMASYFSCTIPAGERGCQVNCAQFGFWKLRSCSCNIFFPHKLVLIALQQDLHITSTSPSCSA